VDKMTDFDKTTEKLANEFANAAKASTATHKIRRYNAHFAGRNSAKESLEILARAIFTAHGYMGDFDCSKYCDPSVNFHEPECCISVDFKKAIAAVKARGDWCLEEKP
jgi:hypothetical protein